jgi:hypothetical protein
VKRIDSVTVSERNSIPTVTSALPVEDGVFEVLDLMDFIIYDLDHYSANGFEQEQNVND